MTSPATVREINAQPKIWRDWAPELAAQAAELRGWIENIAPDHIWLAGAGTSAFAGQIVAEGRVGLRAVATTDIVACPQDYLHVPGSLLVVQFGRSGNSSESLGLLDLLDKHRPDAHRLHITCNSAGALATRSAPGPGTQRAVTLPDATHDEGFAMTSSFSTMVLTALACFEPDFDAAQSLPFMADIAEPALDALWQMPAQMPARAVFLGAGAMLGAARESALKVSELTAGRVATLWDTPLGFRHGPKAFVDEQTTIYLLRHPNEHTALYDKDLAAEVMRQFPDVPVMQIGAGDIPIASTGIAAADAVMAVLPAQVLGARWSAELGYNVDNPFEAHGNLTRVVAGVNLHPWVGA